jgi:hypothetical protein
MKWRALCGAPRYSWIVTATGMYATTMTVRHISMANCALALAILVEDRARGGSCVLLAHAVHYVGV